MFIFGCVAAAVPFAIFLWQDVREFMDVRTLCLEKGYTGREAILRALAFTISLDVFVVIVAIVAVWFWLTA